MPKKINLIGQVFGRLTVIGEAPPRNKKTYWLCQCSCGNQKEIRADSLKDGSISSCGCKTKEGIDLTGQKFGKLTAIEWTGEYKGSNKVWKFQCECGNEINIDTSKIRIKRDLSCGCNYSPIKDITGNKYNHLTVIKDSGKRASDGSVIWECLCDCGKKTEVSSNNLVRNHTKSCGCLISSGEEYIAKILDENNIKYIRQKTFEDCRDKSLLRFDFYLPDYNKCIEYDGIFHYTVTSLTTKKDLENQQRRDAIKEKFCQKHNISLLRIPYYIFDKINIDFLLS